MTLFAVAAVVAWAFGTIVVLLVSVVVLATVLDRFTGCCGPERRRILESRSEHAARLSAVEPDAMWPRVVEHLVVERARADRVAAVVSLDAYRAERGWDAA